MILNVNKEDSYTIKELGLEGVIRYRSKTVSNYDFTSKQYRSITTSYDTIEGFSPIPIQVACSSHSAIRVFNFYINDGKVIFEAVNENDSSVKSANFTIYLLYVKKELLN